jgi:hypothetical protein
MSNIRRIESKKLFASETLLCNSSITFSLMQILLFQKKDGNVPTRCWTPRTDFVKEQPPPTRTREWQRLVSHGIARRWLLFLP